MARDLSEEQRGLIVEALRAVPDIREPSDLQQVVKALRESRQTEFKAEELNDMEATFRKLEVPMQARGEWTSSPGRGLFYVFEGLDRSGKSSQSRMLRGHLIEAGLSPRKVGWRCFPKRNTAIGCLIDLYLKRLIELPDKAIHLLFSANRWEEAGVIVEELNSGISVVCDRYAFSGVAYSAAKGLDFDWCCTPDRGLPCPDTVFFLHVDPEVGASRADFGDERYENARMQASVREEFKNSRLHDGVLWHVINGARVMEEVHQEIVSKLLQPQESVPPIKRLWPIEGGGAAANSTCHSVAESSS